MATPHDESGFTFHRRHAFRRFVEFEGRTQSGLHIRPLHEYITCRLVLEGGFHPDELSPRPPFAVTREGEQRLLAYEPDGAEFSEATILGGLKTKNVDVVVDKPGVGPVLAVSCKGMTGAVRNLTNRLEETIGECTNIHIAYPTLVFGFVFLIRANQSGGSRGDVVIDSEGQPVEGVIRFHQALSAMTGRLGVRNDVSRYEAIAMALVETAPARLGEFCAEFPPDDSNVHFDGFFSTMYRRYDERYVVSAPALAHRTRRLAWSRESPALDAREFSETDYRPRLSG